MKWKLLAVFAMCALGLRAQDEAAEVPALSAQLEWRGLGPAVMGGRIVEIAVHPSDKSCVYAAAATGGVWKSLNRGTTWTSVFDAATSTCIGALVIAPSNPKVLYVGTGEANNQRSSYSGDGLWKSVDAGATWQHMGLERSHHIARIAVHPTDENTVFVAVLGALYTSSEERGLYRSTDGGATFTQVLKVTERTGVVDVLIDPANPSVMFAASYERLRRPWHLDEAGPGSGVWKSEDAGSTWKRLDGGLPTGEIGRIGLTLHSGNPGTLYVCVENRNPRKEAPPAKEPDAPKKDVDKRSEVDTETARGASSVEADDEDEELELREHYAPGMEPSGKPEGGQVWRSTDGGAAFSLRNKKSVWGDPAYYYGQIRVDPANAENVWLLGVNLFRSIDGGETWKDDGARGVHSDHHALWIDPTDSTHLLLGNDGGLAVSWDSGSHWDVFENLPLGQFYAVHVDNRWPYRIYGGLQDNGSYGMPSLGAGSALQEWELFRVGGGDGFMCATDPEDPASVYSEFQFGEISRLDLRTMQRKHITPANRKGMANERWNWMTPLLVSKHQPRRVYCASQHVWRSEDRGNSWTCISADLSTDDALKKQGNVPHCTVTMLAESPLRADVLWAGTDDGRLHVTRNGGQTWQDVSSALPASARGLWVSRIVASAHEPGRAWVAINAYREDRFEPLLYLSDDYGGTFAPRCAGLPAQPINSVVEDPAHADLIFVAHDRGVAVSEDGGGSWAPLSKGLPPVPVHDLVLQARDSDLVAATHGRGIFVVDIAPLRDFQPAARKDNILLAQPKLVAAPFSGFSRGDRGARFFAPSNGKVGAYLWVSLPAVPTADMSLVVEDAGGRVVRTLTVKKEAGAQRVLWDLTGSQSRGSASARTGAAGRGRDTGRAARALVGRHVVRLLEGEKEVARAVLNLLPGIVSVSLPRGDEEEGAEEETPSPSGHAPVW